MGNHIDFYAHTREGDSSRKSWQRLEDHLTGTGERAKINAAFFGAEKFAWIAGLLHDLGKYSNEFQEMLNAANAVDAHIENGRKSHKKRVDHSTAGAQHAEKAFAHKNMGRLLAYVIAGHHAGLPNGSDGAEGGSSLEARLSKKIHELFPPKDFLQLFKHETLGLEDLPFTLDQKRVGFQIGFFIRMLYSTLVDADFLDTEAFLHAENTLRREGYPTLAELEGPLFAELERLQTSAKPTSVNRRRAEILQDCLAAAEKEPGLFSLTVPTGGGKTLSSLAFGIRHALKHGLRRIIYVIPFTSIIEQNAKVFRKIFAKAGLDAVIEHHSNFEPEPEKEEEEEYHRYRLACENWDAPIIVTTNVQFFESLFANRSSRCRKLHNIAGSVVILDEVQTLPAKYLMPCIETLRELSKSYRTSIVLCSATQPALRVRDDFREGLENVREIISDTAELFADMKRVKVQPLFDTSCEKLAMEKLPDEQLAAKIRSHEHGQVLCVVNTRKHAREIFERIRKTGDAYHLSALMCPAHRTKIFDEIRGRLKAGKPCRVVSTQLIEAGVDIDFPAVYRAMAGIDSIAQAAGRCNREGKQDCGTVYIFNPEGGIPQRILDAAQTAEGIIRHFPDDILCLDAIEEFFRDYYWSKGDRLDEERIIEKLSAGAGKGNFPFKAVAGKFRLIDDEKKPVIIPWGDKGRELVDAIRKGPPDYSLNRKAQRFTVQIYPNIWNDLVNEYCDKYCVEILHDQYPVLIQEDLYKNDLGLCPEDTEYLDPERLVP